MIDITHYNISSAHNLKLALIADLHETDPHLPLSILMDEKPDAILIAGDLMSLPCKQDTGDEHSCAYEAFYHCSNFPIAPTRKNRDKTHRNALTFLSEASNIAPCFYAAGNHECGMNDEMRAKVKASGAILLEDEWFKFNSVLIGGLSSRKPEELNTAWIAAAQSDIYKILICHHPEYSHFLHGVDLIVSGHAHGGQIRLFGQGLYSPGQGVLPKLTSGTHDVNGATLVISRGLANTAALIPRLWNRRELVIIEI